MSTYDDASLIYYPSGYKASKAYSLKPTDGSGDLTFTRASSATRVNESGLIESVATGVPRIDFTGGGCGKLLLEPQRTNVITYSEELSSSFAVSGGSITSNTTISPDGTTNADTFTPDGTGIGARIQILTFSLTANIYTASIFAKADVNDTICIEFALFTGGVGTVRSFFDLTSGTTPTSEAKIENYGNGWYRCTSAPYTISAGDTVGRLYVNSTPSDTVQLWPTAAASNGQSVILWGAQAELGFYSTSYIRTTTGVAVTRVADSSPNTSFLDYDSDFTFFYSANTKDINNASVYYDEFVGYLQSRITTENLRLRWSSVNYNMLASNTYFKLALVKNSTNVKVFLDGVLEHTITTLPSGSANITLLESEVLSIMTFPTALSDTEAIALTTL